MRLYKPGHSGRGSILAGPLFDARQCLLSESTAVPDANWHTSSLLQRLRSALMHPPRSRRGEPLLVREIDATNSLAFLGQRGFDTDRIVRFGLSRELPTRVALWVIDWRSRLDQDDQPPTWLTPWLEALERRLGDEDSSDIGQLLAAAQKGGFIDWIERWLQQTSLENVVSWTATDHVMDGRDSDDGQARWMIDRFAETYLRDWAETSLQHEYRYLRGKLPAPVAVDEMLRRHLSMAEVDRELARRAVESSRSRLDEISRQAIALLGEGRRPEAAALFDAARILEPQDAEAHNNYGFCLTPDDPAAALRALARAEELDTSSKALNLLNQSVALRLLGRSTEALDCAERAHAEAEGSGDAAWLWINPASADGASIENLDLLPYIRRLGQELAEGLGDDEQLRQWRTRLADTDSVMD